MGRELSPHILTFDDVCGTPGELRAAVLKLPFSPVKSPVDEVTYPFIAPASDDIKHAVYAILSNALHGVVHINWCFARAMPVGVKAPHEIHNDQSMGMYSAHIYLNPDIFPHNGTQFWSHLFFGDQADPAQARYFERMYDPQLGTWKKDQFISASFNRLLIHNSKLWHSATPKYGFGEDQHDGRLVLTTFFDLET